MTTAITENKAETKEMSDGRARWRASQFKPGQSGNPLGKPKGATDKSTKIRNLLFEVADNPAKKRTLKGIIDQLWDEEPLAVLQCLVKLQPKETHTTIESKRLVVNIMQLGEPTPEVSPHGTQRTIDVVPNSGTNAT